MANTKLISAIRETIIDLKTGRRPYYFMSPDRCNCGMLVNNICPDELKNAQVKGELVNRHL